MTHSADAARTAGRPAGGASINDARWAKFRRWLEDQGYAPATVTSYLRACKHAEDWLEAADRPRLFNAHPPDLRRYASAALVESYASRNQAKNAINAYMAFCGRSPLPRGAVPVPRRPRMKSRALEPEQLEKILVGAAEMGPVMYAICCCGYYGALRRFEIVKLRWADLGEDGNVSVVGKGYQQDWVPVHPALHEALDALPRSSEWVFPSPVPAFRGRHLAAGTVNLWFRRLSERTGVEITPHLLRHTAITDGYERTQDAFAVQLFARHADVRTTQGYTRVRDARVRSVVEAL